MYTLLRAVKVHRLLEIKKPCNLRKAKRLRRTRKEHSQSFIGKPFWQYLNEFDSGSVDFLANSYNETKSDVWNVLWFIHANMEILFVTILFAVCHSLECCYSLLRNVMCDPYRNTLTTNNLGLVAAKCSFCSLFYQSIRQHYDAFLNSANGQLGFHTFTTR